MGDDVVVGNGLKVLLPCLFLDDVLCSFRKDVRVRVMSRCLECPEYKRFELEMDAEDDEFWREVDDVHRKEGFSCYCDGKSCDSEVLGSCFSTEGHDSDVLRWVCPRFDVNRFPDGSLIKSEFLRLHKRGVL